MRKTECKGTAPIPECVDRLARIEEKLESIDSTMKTNTESLREHMARTSLMESKQAAFEVTMKTLTDANVEIARTLAEVKAYKGIIAAVWKPATLIGGSVAMLALGAKSDVILGLLKALSGVGP